MKPGVTYICQYYYNCYNFKFTELFEFFQKWKENIQKDLDQVSKLEQKLTEGGK